MIPNEENTNALELDYADRRRSWSVTAILALASGICSGPVMLLLVRMTGVAYGISQVGSGIVLTVGAIVGAYCIWTFTWLGGKPRTRGRILAVIGLVVTILWSIALIALFFDVESQLT